MLDYIPDSNYAEPGFVKGVPGIHGDVRFTYLPYLAAECCEYLDLVNASSKGQVAESEFVKVNAKVHDHLKSWSIKTATGGALEINEANMKKLKPGLLNAIAGIVRGTRLSDPDEKAGTDGKPVEDSAKN